MIIRFVIEVNSEERVCEPRYGSGLSLVLSVEDDTRYLREKIEGDLTFQRGDYDFIMAQALTDKMILRLDVDNGSGWEERLSLEFYRIDCKVDEIKGTVKIGKSEIIDPYTLLLNGKAREYDVFKIGVEEVLVNYKRQPLIQIYTPGHNTITNIVGGNSWEEEVNVITADSTTLRTVYFFEEAKPIYFIPGAGQLAPDVSGEYTYNSVSGWYEKGSFSVRFNGGTNTWNIHENSGGGIVFPGTAGETDEFAAIYDNGASSCQLHGWRNFIRILSNQSTVGGDATNDIPENDIVSPRRGYSKVIGLDYDGIFGSDDNTVLPTEFGRFSSDSIHFAGNYFEFPENPSVGENYYPIIRSNWKYFSAWIYFDSTLQDYQEDLADDLVAHGFLFGDVLDRVVNTIDERVGHSKVEESSDFLYADSNEVRGGRKYPILVPKSNILVGDYDQPDSKEIISLQNLEELMMGFWNASWIVEEGEIKIEHERYWRNGRSYIEEVVGADLDTLEEPKNELAWSFVKSEYEYDVDRLYQRMEYNWDDDTSSAFNGEPIESREGYTKRGTVKKYPIGRISSDIDFAMASPDDISKEGFFMLECELVGGAYVVPFVTVEVDGLKNVKVQNGYASMRYGHEVYWDDGLPGIQIVRNLQNVTALSAKRTKKRDGLFAGSSEFDYYRLARYLGELLEIKGVRVSLVSGTIFIEGVSDTI